MTAVSVGGEQAAGTGRDGTSSKAAAPQGSERRHASRREQGCSCSWRERLRRDPRRQGRESVDHLLLLGLC